MLVWIAARAGMGKVEMGEIGAGSRPYKHCQWRCGMRLIAVATGGRHTIAQRQVRQWEEFASRLPYKQ